MRLETTPRRLDELRDRLRYVYRRARERGVSPEYLKEARKNRVWDTKKFQGLPRWAQSHLDGYNKALWDIMYREHLEWRVLLDGEYILGSAVPKGAWEHVAEGAHFWKEAGKKFC